MDLLKSSVIFFCLLLFSVVVPVCAKAENIEDIYFVKNINVDVTAENATKAREQAMNNGVNKAFEKVVNRLITRFDRAKLPPAEEVSAMTMVKELTVLEEKNSAVRYIAKINVSFKQADINNFLSSLEIPFIQSKGNSVLVLPVFHEWANSQPILWEESNKWKSVWLETPPDSVVVPVFIPLMNEDVVAITAQQADKGSIFNTEELKQKLSVENIYIASATVFSGQEPRVEISIKKAGVGYAEVIPGFSVAIKEGESLSKTLQKAASLVVEAIEDEWKQNQVVRFDASSSMIALIPTGNLKDWVRVKQILVDMPLVKDFELQAMKKDRAQVKLNFSGTVNRFANELAKENLVIESMGAYWIIRDKDKHGFILN